MSDEQMSPLMTHHSSLITMSVKESSDELNPPVVTTGRPVLKPQAARSAKDYLALAVATCGVGYLPLAPGTWGSLLAIGLYLALEVITWKFIRNFAGPNSFLQLSPGSLFIAAELLLITLVTLRWILAASRAAKLFARKDPGKVVDDEGAGQLIALLSVLQRIGPRWLSIPTA